MVPKASLALFTSATKATVGDGNLILFWEDRWLNGSRLEEIAPLVYATVSPRAKTSRLLKDALSSEVWVTDIRPDLSFEALMQYLTLWHRIQGTTLRDGVEDVLSWSWEDDGQFSVRSAYASKFAGKEVAATVHFTWKSRAPLRCRFFVWLAMKNRCWTADRLARRGVPHNDTCPFCDQEETLEHIQLTCMFARTVWRTICTVIGKPLWKPTVHDTLTGWQARSRGGRAGRPPRVPDARGAPIRCVLC